LAHHEFSWWHVFSNVATFFIINPNGLMAFWLVSHAQLRHGEPMPMVMAIVLEVLGIVLSE